MNKRLRKKKRDGELKELGFEVLGGLHRAPHGTLRVGGDLIDELVETRVVSRGADDREGARRTSPRRAEVPRT